MPEKISPLFSVIVALSPYGHEISRRIGMLCLVALAYHEVCHEISQSLIRNLLGYCFLMCCSSMSIVLRLGSNTILLTRIG